MGTTAHDQQQTQNQGHQATSPEALIEVVRLLARRAAIEAFALAQPAASEPDNPEPEDSREVEA